MNRDDLSDFIIDENHVLVKYLGNEAIVNIPESVEKIGIESFSNCESVEKINIPSSVRKIEHFAFSNCAKLNSIIIPDSVEELYMTAFLDCGELKNLKLPSNLNGKFNMKGDMLISYTGFDENIIIPPYVNKIGKLAFAGCSSLKTISVYKDIDYIDRTAFSCCRSFEKINYLCVKPPLKYSKEDFIIENKR